MTDNHVYGCADCNNAVLTTRGSVTPPDECPACGHTAFFLAGVLQ